ncbi:MAG: hypothetical protein GY778_20795 [bacterium]|nr:hypothetical protein [bacterium]
MHRLEDWCHTYRVLTARSEHLTSDMSSVGVKDLGTWEYTHDARSKLLSAIQSGTIFSGRTDAAEDHTASA